MPSPIATVTLQESLSIIDAVAAEQTVLLLAPPGVGKSSGIELAVARRGLELKRLDCPQLLPEDITGAVKVTQDRSVFCPPRLLLPAKLDKPFAVFLDDLTAAALDTQPALYTILLERRIGEHRFPRGTWVVAAGNRATDQAAVKMMSSALVNKLIVLHLAPSPDEWVIWAERNGIREDVLNYIRFKPKALCRPVPAVVGPYSSPRSWAKLSQALDLTRQKGVLTPNIARALALGLVSPNDALNFQGFLDRAASPILPLGAYLKCPEAMPVDPGALFMLIRRIRAAVERGRLSGTPPDVLQRLLRRLPAEARCAVFDGLTREWERLGATSVLATTLVDAVGL